MKSNKAPTFSHHVQIINANPPMAINALLNLDMIISLNENPLLPPHNHKKKNTEKRKFLHENKSVFFFLNEQHNETKNALKLHETFEKALQSISSTSGKSCDVKKPKNNLSSATTVSAHQVIKVITMTQQQQSSAKNE
ncbi:conserved hypothetical protein [Trichinella spiralis]|uniref:hypothetical protein n=1 Tax=Trichinella spiralis TaxID=6334 RepID=UPI0001EFF07B|nr:conserved hypothetical protein [Trichinella spiralis]